MGWFFGFKLHLICNERGELLNFMVTPGDVDDRKPLEYKRFIEMIFDKLVADKGYISKNLFQKLFVDGIQLITKLKSNMKGALMSVSDRVLLRKRAIIESVNDELKNIAQIEYSRHRSVCNFAANMLGAVAAYSYFPKKPSIQVVRVLDNQLNLFLLNFVELTLIYSVESLCKSSFTERNPIGRRTESDWVANGIRLDGERERWQNERNHSTKQGAVVSVSL